MKLSFLFFLSLVLTLLFAPSANAVNVNDVKSSEWETDYEDSPFTFRVRNQMTFDGATGKYVTKNNGTGTLSEITYTQDGQKVKVAAKWALGGGSGKVTWTIFEDGNSIGGNWTTTGSTAHGTWGGIRKGLPDPVATELKKPKLGARETADVIHRHAVATVRAAQGVAGPTCTLTLLGHGSGFENPGHYNITVRQKKGGVTKDTTLYGEFFMVPLEAGKVLTNNLKDAGSPCSYDVEPAKESRITIAKAIQAATTQMETMTTALASAEGPTLRGRINAPSILVSDNEVVVVDPMDFAKQKNLLNQVNKGIPPQIVTDLTLPNGQLDPAAKVNEKSFGDPNIISIRVASTVAPPTGNNISSFVGMLAELTFVNKKMPVFNGYFVSKTDVEFSRIELSGELKMMTPQGEKTVQTLDEKKNTTWEKPEKKFHDDVVLFKYPPVCTPTPIGPACIEGSVVGSSGVRPYGVKMNAANFQDFIAYYRPYARIAIEVFGGLEYGIAHAGVRGSVSVMDGTVGLLAGKIGETNGRYCARAELDKMEMLNGRIFADIQAQYVPDEAVAPIREKVDGLCTKVKTAKGQVMDVVKNIQEGVGNIASAARDTADQVADTVNDVGDAVKDTVGDVSGAVSSALPSVSSKVPLVPFALTGDDFVNTVKDLKQMECGKVIDKLADVQKIRYLKEIYHWSGMVLDRHHKWYEGCTTPSH